MKAVRIHAFGGVDQFRVEEAPDPVAGPGEVLVRVQAASLNPVDSYVRQGHTRSMWPIELPAILGVDGAGTIEALGDGVTAFAVGDRVVVRASPSGHGTHADLVAVAAEGAARIPDAMGCEQAATLPLVGLTGRQLVDLLGDIPRGARVLVSGALGSVGRAAVQYLREMGATPVAGVRAERLAEGEALAGEAVDLGRPPAAGAFDLAIAAAAPAVGATLAFLRDGGHLTSAVQVPEADRRPGVTVTNMMAHDDAAMLRAVIEAAARGDLTIPVAATFPLDRLAEAHAALDAHPSGKIVVTR